ncbi:hypothetical protein K9L16_02725 [Candidatus Pacearchaeota archaeon]|nr:hypothetical protein [Candidatus Pacearchaeota archaeon]
MEKERIFEVLESIGLKKNEITIYLDLIRFGKSSPMDISKRTGLHRSNTYDLIESLKKKGFLDETTFNDKKYYYPIEPEDIFDYVKQKQKEVEGVVDDLKKIETTKNEERQVFLSEGLNSVKNIITRLLELNQEILAIAIPREIEKILKGFLSEFHRKRIKKKIPIKVIYEVRSLNQIRKLNEMDLTEARYLPIKSVRTSTLICNDKVVMIIWDEPITSIVINSEAVANSYKECFKILWNEAEVKFE